MDMVTVTEKRRINGMKTRSGIIKIITTALILVLTVTLLSSCGSQKKTETKKAAQPQKYKGYTTFAFFGVDSRAEENKGRSDVIMLITINNDKKSVKVTSVYRDTLLDISGDGSDSEKCNAAYAWDGPEGAVDMLERNLDVKIDGYFASNFKAVADAVDTVGGVKIYVQDSEIKYLNSYIKEYNEKFNQNIPDVTEAGMQQLNGGQAVAYSRIRYLEGGDFARTRRQQNVVSQMFQQIRRLDKDQQNKVFSNLYKTVDTDMSKSELMNMADVMIKYNLSDMGGFPYKKSGKNLGSKGDCVIPCDLEENVIMFHKKVYGDKNYQPSETVKDYSSKIVNETGLTKDDAADYGDK